MVRILSKLKNRRAGATRFNDALAALEASYSRSGDDRIGFNICADCLATKHLYLKSDSLCLMAHGLCSSCATICLVCDLELLALYRAAGLSNSVIAETMPILRQDFPTRPILSQSAILEKVRTASRLDEPQTGGDD